MSISTLDPAHRSAIMSVLSSLPYGGLVMHRLPRREADDDRFIEQVVDCLSGLRAELIKVAEQNDRREAELRELQRQRDAIRSFLGIEQLAYDLGTMQATAMQELKSIADVVDGER